ncbi:hypothetical protein CK215_24805 [Mesorhizobium sp. WSM3864]|nr:hypothetical protein CK215_24805 [Mesorhizobium sp. WSM3864]
MEDCDWLKDAPSFAELDWSHQSIHPDTRLDRYIDLDMAAGPDFVINDATVINLHGGVKYTDMKWKAYGGSYQYSGEGFRDYRGESPDRNRASITNSAISACSLARKRPRRSGN